MLRTEVLPAQPCQVRKVLFLASCSLASVELRSHSLLMQKGDLDASYLTADIPSAQMYELKLVLKST